MERRKGPVEVAMNRLTGANMDIDLATLAEQISWKQDKCPWNAQENSQTHRCAAQEYIDLPLFLWGGIPGYVAV